ncbi:MAG: HAD hydrolase-like protein [Candidatus Dependentiae bacterium]|nr:HAD hydrolase-like protein [Candidatus Dependentiae bacterium]
MKKTISTIFLSLILSSQHLKSEAVSAIFFDIQTIFQIDSMRASNYIGKFDSLRYLAEVGNIPRQEDLFRQLKPVKALSTQITYNQNLEMPLIFSDWLSAKQAPSKVADSIQKYFKHKNISDIEKKVFLAIVNMMVTSTSLADIQYSSSKIETLIEKLKRNGYKIYLVGNSANISSLRSKFKNIFKLFTNVYVSGELHLLKPYKEFYQAVLERSEIKPQQALWIETEQKFSSKVQQFGYNAILYSHSYHEDIIRNLQKFGVRA